MEVEGEARVRRRKLRKIKRKRIGQTEGGQHANEGRRRRGRGMRKGG